MKAEKGPLDGPMNEMKSVCNTFFIRPHSFPHTYEIQ